MSAVRWESRQWVSFELLLLNKVYVTCRKMSVHWDTQHMTFRLSWTEDLKILFFLGFLLPLTLLFACFFLSFFFWVLVFVQLWIQSSQLKRRRWHWNRQNMCLYKNALGNGHDFKPSMALVELILPCTDSHKNAIKTRYIPPLHFSLLLYFCWPGLQSWRLR